jgi:hypothetical protein
VKSDAAHDVRPWQKADMPAARANVRFRGKAAIDQPLLTTLDLRIPARGKKRDPVWARRA